jgi:Tfp pilus assembly protein PilF
MLEEDVWMQSTANSSKASITEDACFNALNSNQPLLAVQEAQSLLKQKALPQKTAHLANLCLGRGWFAQGELNKALPPLLEAARLAGNTEERAAAFSSLGAVYGKQGKLDMAQAAYRKQLAAAEELGDASKQASSLSALTPPISVSIMLKY